MCDFDLFALADIADILGDIQGDIYSLISAVEKSGEVKWTEIISSIGVFVSIVFSSISL